MMIEKHTTLKTGWNIDNSYACLPKVFFTRQNPIPVSSPQLVILNYPLATSLGLNITALESQERIGVLAGNCIPDGALPLAQAYAGHQFGNFALLGDGRVILLGEQITPQGERFDIQLKGSGKTPYSRRGDGRAALGPMLREYIISEAMYGLGIATTRSLAVVKTGELVARETLQPGAILTRVATSHLRVGTFQYAANWGTIDEVKMLADYTLQRHFPGGDTVDNPYLFLLRQVIRRQASLIAKWQLVGFIHGVMNTDNMAISGETIDYGPCAFMDTYDPETVFSSIDHHGRYAYGNQPQMAGWNLSRFAESVLPLLHDNHEGAIELAQEAISDFPKLYQRDWLAGMRAKLGMFTAESGDEALIENLLTMMQKYRADYTNTFNALTFATLSDRALFGSLEFVQWHEQWQERLSRQEESRESSQQLMKNANPAIIPRNHRVEEALNAAQQGDYGVMERLLAALASPYAHSPEQVNYAGVPRSIENSYRTFCGT